MGRQAFGRMVWIVALAAVIGWANHRAAQARASAGTTASTPAGPLVAILTPDDGARGNWASLNVRALVTAAKRIVKVDILLDGRIVQTVDGTVLGRQAVIDVDVNMKDVTAGAHFVTVTATQSGNSVQSETASVTLDPMLPRPELNRVERAATPTPFAAFMVRNWEGRYHDAIDDESAWRAPERLDFEGAIVLSPRSDGIDVTRDRIVVSVDSTSTVFEAGALRCEGKGEQRVCRIQAPRQPLVQVMEVKRGGGRWQFRIAGATLPANARVLSLRIGNDWGAIDLRTGARIAELQPDLDRSHQAQEWIGPQGGRLETIDASGMVVRLEVLRGALTRDTLITMTPFARSNGVHFEPEGLVFTRPAVLTFDYRATGRAVRPAEQIRLATSPLTALPLFGSADPARGVVTAYLNHFSTMIAGITETQFADLRAWADPILAADTRPTLLEIQSLLELLELQQQTGCTDQCVDAALVTAKVGSALLGVSEEACTVDVGDPSDTALERWIALVTLGQTLNADATPALNCAGGVLRTLILEAPEDLTRLAQLADRAQRLGLDDDYELARTRMEDLLRGELNDRRALCPTDENNARTLLAETLAKAEALGFNDLETEITAAVTSCHAAPPPPPAPAPIPATGCDADIASPTDAALDRWLLVEAAAPAGADVSAVESCVASIFGGLIARNTAEAGSTPTDAQLQRYVDLAAKASRYGYTASRAAALAALDGKLRALLTGAQALCSSDATNARAAIQRVLGWAVQVADVDPSLGADAQAAMAGDACQASRKHLTAVLSTEPGIAASIVYLAPGTGGPDYSVDGVPAGDTPLPVVLSAARDGASATSRFVQTADDTIEWQLDASWPGMAMADPLITIQSNLHFTAGADGLLELKTNPAWSATLPGYSWGILVRIDGRGTWIGIDGGKPTSTLDRAIPVATGQTVSIVVLCQGLGLVPLPSSPYMTVSGPGAVDGTFITFRLY